MKSLSILKEITQNHNIYIVGGFIRDYLMGNKSKDIDLVVMSNVENIVDEFTKRINNKRIILDEVRGIYRVITDSNIFIDFSNPVGQDLFQDLGCRDFTCNSIAVKLNEIKLEENEYYLDKEKMIDPFGGINDIENRVLKMVHRNFVKEDPARILRAYRFSNNLDFDIENETANIINNNIKLIKTIKNERIKVELIKMFDNRLNNKTLEKFLNSGIIIYLFNVNTYKKRNKKEILLKQNNYILQKQLLQNCTLKNYIFNLSQLFLHPIIKGEVTVEEIEDLLINYTFNKKDIKTIKDHLWSSKMVIKNIVVYKNRDYLIYQDLFNKNIDPETIKSLLLSYTESTNIDLGIKNDLIDIVEKFKIMKKRTSPKLIDGDQIQDILDLGESKIIGDILEEIRRRRALGLLKSKEEIYDYLENTFNKRNKS
ncbi:MAG: hypothetical protein R6V14_08795 [Halanaerobiales bacterium]